MAQPFLSEIRLMSFVFPPKGWALCNGQFMPINQNQALFSLLGTTYGGNGQTTFALPNLQGRMPVHMGNGYTLGQVGGASAHTLSHGEMPTHTHQAIAVATATQLSPESALWAGPGKQAFGDAPEEAMHAESVTGSGGAQAHSNVSPYLALSFCIALTGIFPSQN